MAEALNPKILLAVLGVPNDIPLKGELLGLPKVVSFSVLAFKSVVSAVGVIETVGIELDVATLDPNLKTGAAGNEGAAAEVEMLLCKAVVVVVPLVVMVAVVEDATLLKLFVKVLVVKLLEARTEAGEENMEGPEGTDSTEPFFRLELFGGAPKEKMLCAGNEVDTDLEVSDFAIISEDFSTFLLSPLLNSGILGTVSLVPEAILAKLD